MPDWVLTLIVGFIGGIGATLLRLHHERAAELRTRMLEAADDFVAAYALARDRTSDALIRQAVLDSVPAEREISAELQREWKAERTALVTAAREACDELKRRYPRIRLLFGQYSPAERSAWLAWAPLEMIAGDLSMEPAPPHDPDRANRWREADKALDEFSRRAREAILASPWSIRPVFARSRMLRLRIARLLARFRRKQ